MSQDVVSQRYAKWGGIARYVYSLSQSALEEELEKKLRAHNFAHVDPYRNNPEISDDDQKVLSHMVDSDERLFERCRLDFASEWIGMQVVKQAGKKDYEDLKAHYIKVRDQQWQGPYAGHLWSTCVTPSSRKVPKGLS